MPTRSRPTSPTFITGTGSITVPTVGGFSSWQSSQFTPGELANPLVSGDNADPDGDGLSNALEYAFGSEPKSNSSAFLPQSSTSSGQLVLSYLRPAVSIPGLSYTIQTNSDLQSGGAGWSTATPATDYAETTSTIGAPVGFEKLTITFSTAIGAGQKKFARISVTC